MNTANRQELLNNLRQIYPEHEWIDLAAYPQYHMDVDTSPADLNFQCLKIVKTWIEETQGFSCKYTFPYLGLDDRDRAIAIGKMLNGFCLDVNDNKIIFIPSENLDLTSWEISQEWVDLSTWLGDYYVPIQVDLEAQYLHLWGVITHTEVKKIVDEENRFNEAEHKLRFHAEGKASPKQENRLRYYSIPCGAMTSELDFLWTACELKLAPRSTNIPLLSQVNATQAQKLIDRVISTPTPNFPRLILHFSEWGAILNHPEYLDRYLNSAIQPTKLTDWLDKQVENISTYWQQIENFLNPPQPQIAFRGFPSYLHQVSSQQSYRDIPLETPEQINQAIAQLYRSQTGSQQIPIPIRITGVEDLIILMEKSSDDNIRWKAIEYLWTINPNHPKLPSRWVRDLGIQFTNDTLALMISQLEIDNQRRAILLRVYPWEREMYLPGGVKLSLLKETGTPVLLANGKPFEAIARNQPQDNYIQLYFVADPRDRFGVRVSLDTQEFTEHFIV